MFSNQIILSRGILVISLFFILCGYTYQSWGVSREYFEYRTTSLVTVQDYTEKDVDAPAIVICFVLARGKLSTDLVQEMSLGELFSGDYLNDKNDTWKILNRETRLPYNEKERYSAKKFIRGSRYCFYLKILNRFHMEDVSSFRQDSVPMFYSVTLTTSPIHSKFVQSMMNLDPQCDPRWANFRVVTDESTLASDIRNQELRRKLCTRNFDSLFLLLTYSSLINVRLPPPYETNCFDYRKEGQYFSSYKCYDDCLKEKMKYRDLVPAMTLIDKEEYGNSSARIVSGKVLEDEQHIEKLAENSSFSGEMIMRQLQTEWKTLKRECKQACSRPDCVLEDISPQISYFDQFRMSKDNGTLQTMTLMLLPSFQPAIQVTSTPKQQLLNYVIFMFSMLSFWLGFCPLTMVHKIVGKLRVKRKKRRERRDRRMTRHEICMNVHDSNHSNHTVQNIPRNPINTSRTPQLVRRERTRHPVRRERTLSDNQ